MYFHSTGRTRSGETMLESTLQGILAMILVTKQVSFNRFICYFALQFSCILLLWESLLWQMLSKFKMSGMRVRSKVEEFQT